MQAVMVFCTEFLFCLYTWIENLDLGGFGAT